MESSSTSNGPVTEVQDDPSFTVEESAILLGLDSFTVYGLIQREKLHAEREPSGVIIIRQSELNRVLQKSEDWPLTIPAKE